MICDCHLPVVHHEFLDGQQGFVADIGVFVGQHRHHQRLATQLLNCATNINISFVVTTCITIMSFKLKIPIWWSNTLLQGEYYYPEVASSEAIFLLNIMFLQGAEMH